jgi:hypothetical protein
LEIIFVGLPDFAPQPFPLISARLLFTCWGALMGRTIPSWRIVVNEEIVAMSRFKQFLGSEDRELFDDLLNQCMLYAPQAGVLASHVKEVPLLLSMIFAHYKKLAELEKRVNDIPN